MSSTFWEGNPVVITQTFEVGTTPTDPTTVTFKIRMPDGTVDSFVGGDAEVTNPEVGVWALTLPGTLEPASYNGRIEGAGDVVAAEEFEFVILPSPTLQTSVVPGPQVGPCMPWTDAESIAAMCGVTLDGSNVQLLDMAAVTSSMLLFELSGEQYPGVCDAPTARPCGSNDGCGWSWSEVLSPSEAQNWAVSWMVGIAGWGWYADDKVWCGCQHVPRIELANYPVVEVTNVTISGVTVDPSTYELRDWRYLDRVTPTPGDQPNVWPTCQNMRLPLGQVGTWSVDYRFGVPPPVPGVLAAQQLGCEIAKFLLGQECALPDGVTSINRQGVSMDRTLFYQWGLKDGQWATGLSWVDGFLQAYNPTGARERSAVWSPDLEPYPRPVNA